MGRWSLIIMVGALLTACGIKKYLPGGPALSASERAALDAPAASGVTYTGPPAVSFPVSGLQVWGASYDLDLVLESAHTDYDMHEYARVQTPDGPVWLAKDALKATKSQSIVADLEGVETWLPELPVARKKSPVRVDDRSVDGWLDLTFDYENLEGLPVHVHYEGVAPHSAQKKRNGNTMGHSAGIVMAVLDIPFRDFGRRATIEIGGDEKRVRRLLGLVPLRVVLVQTQGGLSIGAFTARASDGGFTTTHALAGHAVDQAWMVTADGDTLRAEQVHPFRTLSYVYRDRDGALELERMEVHQYGHTTPIVTIALSPALPDLRRPFDGRATSRFAVDVNDQRGHATGRVEAWWDGDTVRLAMVPEDPEWVADRPMATAIRYADGVADVAISRVDLP